MAEDWAKLSAKFATETKSLLSEINKFGLDDTEELWGKLQDTDKLMEAHEKKLGAAAIDAYEAGVVSKKLAEFMKHKAFADAKKLLDADRSNLVAGLKLLEAHCDKCKAGASKAYELAQRMSKHILADKGKEKNPERDAVKKMRESLMVRFEDLSKAEKMRHKPPAYMTVFDKQYDKLIDHLIAEALKKGKDPNEALEVPQPLTDKNLGLLAKEATRYGTTISANASEIETINTKRTAITDRLEKLEAEKAVAEKKGEDVAKATKTIDGLKADASAMKASASALLDKANKSLPKLLDIAQKVAKLESDFAEKIALLAAKEQADLKAQFKAMKLNAKKAEDSVKKAIQTFDKMA